MAEVISALNYWLEMPGRKRASKIVHVNMLWKETGKGKFPWGEHVDVESRERDSVSSSAGCSSSSEGEDDSDSDTDKREEGVASQ